MTRDIGLDNPATRPEEDAFNRWPFSRRLAETIRGLDTAQGSPVLGLFGKWGDGKSTVLNLVRHALETDHADAVIVCSFNPWLFKDQNALVQEFFTTLAKSVDAAIDKPEKAVGDLLSRYSGALGAIPVVGTALKDVAKGAGEALAADSIEARRNRLVEAMRDAPKRVVVLIDDLDRLDRDEVMTMMKLVRLSANFPNVVYLLAFDEERVARLAGQAYGGRSDGRQFLEKIIQFPFSLPAVGHARLAAYVVSHVKAAAETADLRFSEQEWKGVHATFQRVVLSRLTTPRQAIRYANALRFAMPLMKGEVGPYNQMLVEAARVLFPDLYAVLKNHSDPAAMTADDIMARGRLGPEDRALIEELLRPPPKPITDPRYHDRYFSYAVATDDISDAELLAMLAAAKAGDVGALREQVRHLAADRFDGLVDRLLAVDIGFDAAVLDPPAFVVDPPAAERIAQALASISDLARPFPDAINWLGQDDVFDYNLARAVVRFAAAAADGRPDGDALAEELVATASPLDFALDLYRVMMEDAKSWRNTSAIRRRLVARIAAHYDTRPIDDEGRPWSFQQRLSFWRQADPDGQHRWVEARLAGRPEQALGMIRDATFLGSSYGRATLMCDTALLEAALRIHFGPALDDPAVTSPDLESARRFLADRSDDLAAQATAAAGTAPETPPLACRPQTPAGR